MTTLNQKLSVSSQKNYSTVQKTLRNYYKRASQFSLFFNLIPQTLILSSSWENEWLFPMGIKILLPFCLPDKRLFTYLTLLFSLHFFHFAFICNAISFNSFICSHPLLKVRGILPHLPKSILFPWVKIDAFVIIRLLTTIINCKALYF